MVREKTKREWHVKLQELGVKGGELKTRADELEGEIEQLETELSQKKIRSYKTELLNKLKREFVRAFHERENLIEPMFGSAEEWNTCTKRLRACVIIEKAMDTDEAGLCTNVPEFKNLLRDRLISGLGDNIEEEIAYFLEA